jgi:glycosyltransferase involved in cell wall biosynthesis
MRIGIVSDPMLFQRDGALQMQVRECLRALAALPPGRNDVPALVPFDGDPDTLDDVDALHVFAAGGANARIIAQAAARRVPLVFSPLAAPAPGERELLRALEQAALIVASGQGEARAIGAVPGVDAARIRFLRSGVGAQQFDACGELFRQRTGLRRPFVLVGGPLAPHHQQLALARTLSAYGVAVVVLGQARDPDYLRQIQALPGVTCLGALDHDAPMQRSACAAAAVLVLPCQGDATARTVLDALAAGTPVVLSVASAIDVPDDGAVLRQVLPGDAGARARAVCDLLAHRPSRARVQAAARPFSWERAALQLAGCYAQAARRTSALAA